MDMETHFKKLKEAKKANKRRTIIAIIIVFAAIVWSWRGTAFSIPAVASGVPRIFSFLYRELVPPNFSALIRYIPPTLETLYMAYAGAFLAIIVSLFVATISAKNLIDNKLVIYFGRGISAFLRSVPAVAWAVLLVAAVGLGPFAGTLAIALGGAGMLGKTYADSLEEIDMGQVEALKAVGASWWQILFQAVIPQFIPSFLAWSFYRLDLNIRSAAVVGLVGAGGLGFAINTSLSHFQYKDAAVGILWIFFLILVVEYLTARSRDKIMEGL